MDERTRNFLGLERIITQDRRLDPLPVGFFSQPSPEAAFGWLLCERPDVANAMHDSIFMNCDWTRHGAINQKQNRGS